MAERPGPPVNAHSVHELCTAHGGAVGLWHMESGMWQYGAGSLDLTGRARVYGFVLPMGSSCFA